MKQLFTEDKTKINPMGEDKKYSRAIKVPQYQPKEEKPKVGELYSSEKYSKLVAKIKKSGVSDEEKQFLLLAASRHIVFNYSKIADYYAHSDAEMQKLMEESALVIIDMDDAIANGYVALTEKMKQLIDEEKERSNRVKEAKRVLKEQRALLEEKAKSDPVLKEEIKNESANTENSEKVSE